MAKASKRSTSSKHARLNEDCAAPSAGLEPTQSKSDDAQTHEQCYAGLLPLLQRLDQRIAAAVAAADHVFAARAAGDLYRGLAISPADVVAAFGRVPGEPFLRLSRHTFAISQATDSLSLRRLLWLQHAYDLTGFDLDVLLVALAPEIDLRYERLYAYLQDDVTRRRPSIDLALNLLCASAGEKLQQRQRFAPDSPLIRHRLVDIYGDPHYTDPPLLARFFRLDDQIVQFLLTNDSLDSRLASACRMTTPTEHRNDELLADELLQRLQVIAKRQPSEIRLSFEGPSECGQAQAVALLATRIEMRVLRLDLEKVTDAGAAIRDGILQSAVREAWLRGALLHIQCLTADGADAKDLNALWPLLQQTPIPFVVECESAWIPTASKPLGVASLHFTTPAIPQRKFWWRHCLKQNGIAIGNETLGALTQRYRLNFSQIRDASSLGLVVQNGVVHDADVDSAIAAQVASAARKQTRHLLAKLTQHIVSRRDWSDLVLPEDAVSQLREICERFVHRQKVMADWGFEHKLSYGKGINVLFAGPSGTGKTMAAEIVANELGLDLYKIDLAGIVSKYIGETEKNLDKIFAAAENANAILFFDEADALFGKRTEVKDSHDRYANLETSYLLQKMEQYDGITILATNLRQNLDDAFVRRLAFMVHFPFPGEAHRLGIWSGVWPEATPLAIDVDRQLLARKLKLSGGNIKNIALASTFLAAANGGTVTMEHLLHAAQREYQKLGKTLSVDLQGTDKEPE